MVYHRTFVPQKQCSMPRNEDSPVDIYGHTMPWPSFYSYPESWSTLLSPLAYWSIAASSKIRSNEIMICVCLLPFLKPSLHIWEIWSSLIHLFHTSYAWLAYLRIRILHMHNPSWKDPVWLTRCFTIQHTTRGSIQWQVVRIGFIMRVIKHNYSLLIILDSMSIT